MARARLWQKWTFWHWVTAVALLLLAVVLVYPVGQLLIKSFLAKDGGFTLKNYATFLGKRYYRLALTNSLWVCTVSTI
ncbi:MAG: iron ABC transporter permease, partial [Bacillota bacterium]